MSPAVIVFPSLLFLAYITTSCLGLYYIKSADSWRSVDFLLGFALYGSGAALWLVILRFSPLSYAFPIAAGLLMIGTMLTGYFFLAEKISTTHLVGALLIASGIFMISIGSTVK